MLQIVALRGQGHQHAIEKIYLCMMIHIIFSTIACNMQILRIYVVKSESCQALNIVTGGISLFVCIC